MKCETTSLALTSTVTFPVVPTKAVSRLIHLTTAMRPTSPLHWYQNINTTFTPLDPALSYAERIRMIIPTLLLNGSSTSWSKMEMR